MQAHVVYCPSSLAALLDNAVLVNCATMIELHLFIIMEMAGAWENLAGQEDAGLSTTLTNHSRLSLTPPGWHRVAESRASEKTERIESSPQPLQNLVPQDRTGPQDGSGCALLKRGGARRGRPCQMHVEVLRRR